MADDTKPGLRVIPCMMPRKNEALAARKKKQTPVSDLHLPARVKGILLKAGISTVGDLVQCTKHQLLHLDHFGGKSLSYVCLALKDYGFIIQNGSPSDTQTRTFRLWFCKT